MKTTLAAFQLLLFFVATNCYPVNQDNNSTNSSSLAKPVPANNNRENLQTGRIFVRKTKIIRIFVIFTETQLNAGGHNRTRDLSSQVPTAAPDEFRWPGGIVHFKISGEFSKPSSIEFEADSIDFRDADF